MNIIQDIANWLKQILSKDGGVAEKPGIPFKSPRKILIDIIATAHYAGRISP